jgi:uncharacterized membrane protein
MATANMHGKYTHPFHHDAAPYWFGDHPAPHIRSVTVDQSSRWLARGWSDLWAAPGVSLTYGMMFVVAAYLIFFGLTAVGMESLILPMAAGFMLIGPIAAVGLYDVSRRHADGDPVTLSHAFDTFRQRSGPLMVVGLSLMMALLAWMMVALVIFASFYHAAPPTMGAFFSTLMTAPQAPFFLLVGTLTGGVIAAAVFTVSAISLPMIVDRNASPVYAMATSVRAVAKNWRVMIGWAAMIALVTGFGLATFFIGLAIALPLVGHASWHAYKAIID